MAKGAKYTSQFSVVGTPTQTSLIQNVAERLSDDKAPIVRQAVNEFFGLVDDELADGETMAEAVERVAAKIEQARSGVAA